MNRRLQKKKRKKGYSKNEYSGNTYIRLLLLLVLYESRLLKTTLWPMVVPESNYRTNVRNGIRNAQRRLFGVGNRSDRFGWKKNNWHKSAHLTGTGDGEKVVEGTTAHRTRTSVTITVRLYILVNKTLTNDDNMRVEETTNVMEEARVM